ncbi:MAG: hypothetical protein WCP29_04850 [Acidobacteriota bacterium]
MNTKHATTTGMMMLAVALCAIPAAAFSADQDRSDRRENRTVRERTNSDRGRVGSESPASQSDRRRGSADSRPGDSRRDVAVARELPRSESSDRRADSAPASRDGARRAVDSGRDSTRGTTRGFTGGIMSGDSRADSRGGASYRADSRTTSGDRYGSGSGNRRDTSRAYSGGGYGYRTGGGRYSNRDGYGYGYGYRSHDSLSWRLLRLGLEIFVGDPYDYRFDDRWTPRYGHRFTLRRGFGYGGMSFLVDPDDTAIYIDRQFIGVASDFDGEPVPLEAGYHEVELRASGCQPVLFDITVRPGQVIPYRGSLMGYR